MTAAALRRSRRSRLAGCVFAFALALLGCDRPRPNPYAHAGSFRDVSAGSAHTCAVDGAGNVRCWKYGTVGEATPPAGDYRRISTTGSHACALRTDGRLACWGVCQQGQCAVPPGDFVDVVAGDGATSCALGRDGRVSCWGLSASTPGGHFVQIDVGSVGCGVRPSAEVECWGDLDYEMSDSDKPLRPISLRPPGRVQGHARSVSVGTHHACALLDDQSVACWGDDVAGQASPPLGRFIAVDAGRHTSCALDAHGNPLCWGAPLRWRNQTFFPPAGPFKRLSLGDNHACAIKTSDELVCWGTDQQSQVSGERWLLVRT